jgi:hypothetical protein
MLRCLVYLSTARTLFSDRDLLELLTRSRTRNQEAGITGLLLYSSGNFIQLLEGEGDDVRALYARITQDPRHHNCIQLFDRPADQRLFPDWSMGFRPSEAMSAEEQAAISAFLGEANAGTRHSDDAAAPTALKLLERFARTMR